MSALQNKLTVPAVAAVLRWVFDPETAVNIVDMGLVYGIALEEASVKIDLTYSTPACPLGEAIAQDIHNRMEEFFGAVEVQLNVVFDPEWHPEMMSKATHDSF